MVPRAKPTGNRRRDSPLKRMLNHKLPVEDLIEFLVRNGEDHVMGRQRLAQEVARKPVVGCGEPGGPVEIALPGQDPLTQCGDVVCGQGLAREAGNQIKHGLEGFGLIQDGKGNKHAHAGSIDGRRGDLQIARQFHLAVWLEGIDVAADTQDVGRHGVSGGMVCAHWTGRVGYGDPLDRTRIVGRHGLALDHRDPFDPEHLAGYRSAGAQDTAQRGALTHFLDHTGGCLGIAEVGQSGFHGHRDGGAHFDGVQSEIIIYAVYLGDDVQVIDAAVTTMGPYRFVLGLLGQKIAVLVVEGPGTLHHAAPVAAMGRRIFAAPAFFQFS